PRDELSERPGRSREKAGEGGRATTLPPSPFPGLSPFDEHEPVPQRNDPRTLPAAVKPPRPSVQELEVGLEDLALHQVPEGPAGERPAGVSDVEHVEARDLRPARADAYQACREVLQRVPSARLHDDVLPRAPQG